MKISLPRRELYKQTIQQLLLTSPRLTNIDLGQKVGLHRNTIRKLLQEIQAKNNQLMKEKWGNLLNELLQRAKMRLMHLENLWIDYYGICLDKAKSHQMLEIIKTYWAISKEIYQTQLKFMGIREDPKTLVQVNFQNRLS